MAEPSASVSGLPPLPPIVSPARAEADMQVFLGDNAEPFLTVWRRRREEGAEGFAMTWPAFFFCMPWLLYRKLWIWGGLAVLAPILAAPFVNPVLPAAAIGLFAMVRGKALVCARGERVIARVRARDLPEPETEAAIAAAGGVSLPGLWFGITILLCQVVLNALLQARS